jgi:hypothetical protein
MEYIAGPLYLILLIKRKLQHSLVVRLLFTSRLDISVLMRLRQYRANTRPLQYMFLLRTRRCGTIADELAQQYEGNFFTFNRD